eukprot:TRINITY_DN1438_c0_g2_i1.p1 TRINITY_DN1438_c0_g2~~TRINITY_DN1438_c0_g2_i1.p1  ORF type:complete len:2790 (-),score=923.47 TRINITY_DN1438_c0_g2_i1:15-8384(-)
MEVHGVYSDEPWELQNNGLSTTTFQSDLNITLPAVDVFTANIKQQRLYALDTKTTSATVKLFTYPGNVDVTNTLFKGTTTVPITNGVANFTNLIIERPPAGQYNLSFSSTPPVPTSVLFTVIPGLPYELKVESGAVTTQKSAVNGAIGSVTVSVRDPGNNLVVRTNTSYIDPHMTVSLANSSFAASFTGTKYVAISNTTGTAVFSDLKFARPPTGDYVLQFGVQGVTINITSVATITPGDAEKLVVVAGATTGPHKSAIQTLLSTVAIEARDPGNNLTPLAAGSSIVAANNSFTLAGTTTVTIGANGTAYFTNIRIVRPAVGDYYLQYTMTGVTGTSSVAQVTIGDATDLRVVSGPHSYASDYVNMINNITVNAHDAGGNLVGGTDTATRPVTVSILNATQVLNGTLMVNMTSGTVVFNQLSLLSPPVADGYVLKFTTPGLGDSYQKIIITIGAGKFLSPVQTEIVRACIESVSLGSINVRVLDAGLTYTDTSDVPDRSITPSLITNDNLLTGKSPVSTGANQGSATFTTLAMAAPPAGNYTLRFVTASLLNGLVNIVIHPGIARRYNVKPGNMYTFPSNESVPLGAITIRAHDASNTFVGTYQMSESGALNVTVKLNTAGTSLVGTKGPKYFTNGEVAFNDLSVTSPPIGNYTLEFFSASFVSAMLDVTITVGAPKKLKVVDPTTLISVPSAVSTALPGLVVWALDAGNTFVGSSDSAMRTVSITSDTATVTGQTSAVMVNGNVTFNSTVLSSPYVTTHMLRFSSGSLAPAMLAIQVTSGQIHSLQVANQGPAIYQSLLQVDIATLKVTAHDAGGNSTQNDQSASVTVTLRNAMGVNVGSQYLVNGGNISLANGVANFATLKLTSPPKGEYILTFDTGVTQPVSTNITVVLGPAHKLGTADVSHTYQSVTNTTISNINLQIRDAGDNPMLSNDTLTNRTITVTIVNGTQRLDGTTVRPVVNGQVVFGDLSLINPPVGTYVLRFTSANLVPIDVNVVVNIGPVTKLVVTSPDSYSNATSETVVLGTIVVRGQDAGSNLVGATDTQQRLVNASISAPGVFTLSTLQGTMTNGVVTFNNLRLHRPQAIVYTLSFATNGLEQANFAINIVRGVPVYLDVQTNANPAIINSAPTVNLQPIVIRTLDAGRNFTVTAPLGNNMVAGNANDTNARFAGNPVALNAGLASFSAGTAFTMTNPLVGNYRIDFYVLDKGLFNVSLSFRVDPGAASQLSVYNWMPATYPSTYHTPIQAITIRVLDSAGNFRGPFDTQTRSVTVSGPGYMNGTFVRNTTQGQVVFSDLGFVKSPVANPTLTFATPGLTNVGQNVQTVIGPAASIQISSPASITTGSAQFTQTPDVVVTILDAGNTPVGATDFANNGRVITAAIETVTPAVTASGTTCATVNGTCTMANLVFNSPPTNAYTVTFRDLAMNKLVPGTLALNIQRGLPFALVTNGYSLQTLPSVVDFKWDTITVRTHNAGGNFTDDPTVVHVEAYVIPGQGLITATLVGDTVVQTAAGVAVFSNLRLNSPRAGQYKIGFRAFGMQNTSVNAVVNIGKVWNLVVASFDSNIAKKSDYTTLMEPVTIHAVNAGGDHVGTSDTNSSRIVHVSLLNTTLAGISGTLQTNLNNSAALFDNIKLHNATAAVLTLRFWSTDIRPSGQPVYADIKVTMSVGDVRGLVVFSGSNQQKSCENTFQLSPIEVRTVDAGDNYVTSEDSSTVSVTLVNEVAAVSGNNTEIISAGVADFSQVLLNSPISAPIASGPHVLRFSMYYTGLERQLSVDTPITIIPGTSSRVKITNVGGTANTQDTVGGNFAVTVQYLGSQAAGGKRITLPNVEVRAYDNCHAAQTTASLTLTLQDLDNSLVGSGGLGASISKALPTATMTNGVATFSNVYITPRVGVYRLQITAPGQKPSVLTVTVRAGPIGGLTFIDEYAVPGFTVVTDNKGPLNPPPTVQITDDVGNPLNESLQVRCDLTPQPINLENNQRRTEGGSQKFTDMTVQGVHGAAYSMVCATVAFGAGNELQAPTFTGLSVTACTDPSELGPNSVPDPVGGGLDCKCEPGFFQVTTTNNQFQCEKCGEGTFKDKIGNEPCRRCPQNMNTGGLEASSSVSACICKPGFFNNDTNPLCEPCTDGGLCQSGRPIAPKPGFFRFRAGSSLFFACPNEDACIGGQNATCNTGYTGPLCSVCAEGYGKFGVTCTPCGATETSWVLVILAIFLVCLMLSFLVKTASVERSKNATILKILLNYLQVIAFVGDLSVRWPRAIVEMFQMMRLSLFSLNLHPVDCSIGPTYYERFVTYMVFPFLAFIGPFVWFCIYYLYRRYIRPPITDAWKERRKSKQTYGQGEEEKPWLMTPENIKELQRQCKTQYGLTVLIATFLAHPIITKNSFQMFNCVDFDGFKFVAEDLSVSCDTAEHQFWTAMAVIMVCLYCTGVPVLAVVLLYRNRHQLHTKKVQDRYRFLYDGYKTTRFYWEAVVMIRKVLIVMVIVFYREKPLTQLYSSLWVIFAALIAHLFARPFATHLTSRLEMFSLITTVVTLMTGLLYYSDELAESEEEGVNGFLITLNVVMLLTFLGLLLHGFFKAASQAREVLKKQDQISDLLSKVTDDGKGGEQLEMKSMEKEDDKKKKKKAEAEMGVFDTISADAVDQEEDKQQKKKKKKKKAALAEEEEAQAVATEEEGTKKKKKKKRLDDDTAAAVGVVQEEPEPVNEPEPEPVSEPVSEPEPVSTGMVDLEVPDFDISSTTPSDNPPPPAYANDLPPPPIEEETPAAVEGEEDDGLKKKKKKKKKKKDLEL